MIISVLALSQALHALLFFWLSNTVLCKNNKLMIFKVRVLSLHFFSLVVKVVTGFIH